MESPHGNIAVIRRKQMIRVICSAENGQCLGLQSVAGRLCHQRLACSSSGPVHKAVRLTVKLIRIISYLIMVPEIQLSIFICCRLVCSKNISVFTTLHVYIITVGSLCPEYGSRGSCFDGKDSGSVFCCKVQTVSCLNYIFFLISIKAVYFVLISSAFHSFKIVWNRAGACRTALCRLCLDDTRTAGVVYISNTVCKIITIDLTDIQTICCHLRQLFQ